MSSNQPLSTSRVITQNLVISAAQAETDREVWESSVRDLSTLINLAVLYDEVFLLGRTAEFHHFGPHSDLMSFLADESVVKTQSLSEQTSEEISQLAQKHLAFYLGQDRVEKFDHLLRFALSPSETFYGLVYAADHVEHVRVGDLWLRTVPENVDLVKALEKESDVARGGTFLVRTFLYLAYSDLLKIPFTADSARSAVVNTVLNKEESFFRSRVIKTLQDTYEKYPSISISGSRQIVSPFASVVFERCKGERSRLVKEIQKLRDELRPTRERLRGLEWNALWGSRSESIAAENKLRGILDEIRQHFGPHPGLFSWKRGISLAQEAGDIIDNPTSWKAWLTGILSLPTEIALRLAQRRPVAEIHKLQQDIPGPRTLDRDLHDLFGKLKSEKIP